MRYFGLAGHRLEAECTSLITESPRFIIGGGVVVLGPYSDREWHERFVLETPGSVDWFSTAEVDEFRFDVKSGLLRGVALRVPERIGFVGNYVKDFDSIEELRATPKLVDAANFHVSPTTCHVFEQGALICLREVADTGFKDPVWVDIAPALSLLIVGGDYMGWRLKEPASVLEDSDRQSPRGEIDGELNRGLEEYLELTSFPYLDRIFEGDLRVRGRLEKISQGLRVDLGGRRRREVLINQIDSLIRDWY